MQPSVAARVAEARGLAEARDLAVFTSEKGSQNTPAWQYAGQLIRYFSKAWSENSVAAPGSSGVRHLPPSRWICCLNGPSFQIGMTSRYQLLGIARTRC